MSVFTDRENVEILLSTQKLHGKIIKPIQNDSVPTHERNISLLSVKDPTIRGMVKITDFSDTHGISTN